jgi:hypothetical protein
MRFTYSVCVLVFFLSACGGSGGGGNSKNSSSPPVNKAPVIAATNQTVFESQSVTISASVTDSDGSISEYFWTQVSGPAITFEQSNGASLSFITPSVQETTQVKFELAVKDDDGAQSKSIITVTINFNIPPEVTVQNTIVNEKSEVSIEAVASDADGSIASYVWEQLSGPTVLHMEPQGSSLSFTTPELEESQLANFKLIVFDNLGKQSEQIFSVEIESFGFNFNISGTANEGLSPGATITLKVGEQEFITSSDVQGNYSVDLNLDENVAEELITIVAKDSAADSIVVLKSILGDVQSLYIASGVDKILSYDELSSVNINYLSTALAVLLEHSQRGSGIQNQLHINDALDDFDSTNFAEIMTALTLVVEFGGSDSNFSLPAEVSDTLQFVQSRILLTSYITKFADENLETYQAVKNNLFSEFNTSIPMTEELIKGAHYLTYVSPGQNTGFVSSNTGRLTFNQDFSGVLVDKFSEIPFTWSIVNQTVQISLAQEILVAEDDFCETRLLSSAYTQCQTYLVELNLYFLKLSQNKTLVVVNRIKSHEDNILQAEFTLAGVNFGDGLIAPKSIIPFDKTYVLPLYSKTNISHRISGEFIENLDALKVRFLAGSELNGVTEVDYPTTDINGFTEYQTVYGTWTIETNNTLTVDFPDIAQLNPLNIAYTSSNADNQKVNLLSQNDSGLRSISAHAFVKQLDVVNWNADNVVGIYQWPQTYLSLYSYAWIEYYASGESLYVFVYDDNYDGLISDAEINLRPGHWQINAEGSLVTREYKNLEQGFGTDSYCQSASFDNVAGDNCIVAREREWEVLQLDSNKITYLSGFKVYNEAYRSNGEPYSGTNILSQHMITSNVVYKITERPIPLPQ